MYFPDNHIEHCTDDHGPGADEAGRIWGCETSEAGKFHPRIWLVNLSLHHPECVDARLTTLNEHAKTFKGYSLNVDEFIGSKMDEKDLVK